MERGQNAPAPPRIGPGTSVREIMTRYPAVESIFERHGLLGCGGPNGPQEPVAFFARVHQVDPEGLLAELNRYVAEHGPEAAVPAAPPAQPRAVYPYFLVTSLLVALLLGFTTGSLALASAALGWGLPSVNWLTFIQTHGRLQLYGFAGLFVFGVAYHVVPRFVAVPLAYPRLAVLSYIFVVIGVAASATQAITVGNLALTHLIFTGGLTALLLAALCYLAVLIGTVRSGPTIPLPISMVLVAALWLLVGTVGEVVLGALSQPGQAIFAPAEEPALEAVLEGFLVVTALGVSLRTLPVFGGLPKLREAVVSPVLLTFQAGLVALIGGMTLVGPAQASAFGQPLAAIGALILFGAALAFVWGLRLYEHATLPVAELGTGHGWLRAIRTAYFWLLVGTGLQAIATVQAALTNDGISWGILNAARHALALGFVTLLIVGMASRVVPVFAGKPLWKPWLVDVATVCLAGSVLLRVPLEALVPYGTSAIADPVLAASGPLALTGLIAFALNFAMTMARREPKVRATAVVPSAEVQRPLREDDLLALVLRRPGGLSALLGAGLTFLADPGQRAVAARSLTIAQAARRADRDPAEVLARLNRVLLPAASRPEVDPDQTVAAVLTRWPETLDVFLHHGFTPLADPVLRERLASTISVRQAATAHGVDLEALVADLTRAIERPDRG